MLRLLAAGVLASTTLVAPAPSIAAVYRPSCAVPLNRDDATFCETKKTRIAAERQAVASEDQDVLGRWQIGGLILTVLFSGGATFFAARAAGAAARAVAATRVIERAYLYPLIDGDGVADTIMTVKNVHDHGFKHMAGNLAPWVRISLKNFGKTPGTLIYGEANLRLMPSSGAPEDPEPLSIDHDYVLGSDETTPTPFTRKLSRDLTNDEAIKLEDGELGLVLAGYIKFRDIWGETHERGFSFSYDPKSQRMFHQDIPAST
jgi:hypothetical protein